MILGFTDLELALSDLSSALHYLFDAYNDLPETEHATLSRIIERLDGIEGELCVLFESVERDND